MVSESFKGLCSYTYQQETWAFSVFFGQVRTWWNDLGPTLEMFGKDDITDKDEVDLRNSVPLTPVQLCRW